MKRKRRQTQYPNVRCGKHGPPAPGYAVCVHVACGAKIGIVVPPSPKSLGQILCGDGAHKSVDDAKLVCAICAREKGWVE